MTLTELEKLEALHAAAILARQCADGAHSDQQMIAETINAFPALAKALREAWANVKHLKNQWQQMANLANENLTALKAAERERDEARAELTRLKVSLAIHDVAAKLAQETKPMSPEAAQILNSTGALYYTENK